MGANGLFVSGGESEVGGSNALPIESFWLITEHKTDVCLKRMDHDLPETSRYTTIQYNTFLALLQILLSVQV